MCACVRHWKLGTQRTIASHSIVAKSNGLRGLSSDWDVESKWKESFRVRFKANLDLDKQLSLVLSNYSAVQVFFSEWIFSTLCLPCFHFFPLPPQQFRLMKTIISDELSESIIASSLNKLFFSFQEMYVISVILLCLAKVISVFIHLYFSARIK